MEKRPRSGSAASLNKPFYRKRRITVACQVCRSRKSRCDGATPKCGFCQAVGAECNYVALPNTNEDTQTRLAALEENVQRLNQSVSMFQTDQEQLHSSPGTAISGTDNGSACNSLASRRHMENITSNIDFDMTTYLTDLESEATATSPTSSGSPPVRLFDTRLISAFFDRVHPWYPIFDKHSFEEQYLLASSSEPLVHSTRSALCLLVSAIGVLAINLGQGSDDDSRDYAVHAFQMLHIVISDNTLTGVQCLILYSIYHLLSFKPTQAYNYVTMASYKIQNLHKRNHGQNVVNTELYRRAFYALFIMERELLVQLRLTQSGISTLEEHVLLPSGTFEDGTTDGATITYFLAEIAMQKMLERTDQNLGTAAPLPQGGIDFATLIAKEIEFQIVEWRNNLPATIAFPDSGICRNDLSLFLKMQYNCQTCGIHWHALHKAIAMKGHLTEMYSEGRKCILAFCSFIDASSDFFSKPVMMPHISMALAAVFTMSLAMACVRKEEIARGIVQIEDTFVRAVKILSGYGAIYPAVGHWADVLQSKLDQDK